MKRAIYSTLKTPYSLKGALSLSNETYIPFKDTKAQYAYEEACIPPQVISALSSTLKEPLFY